MRRFGWVRLLAALSICAGTLVAGQLPVGATGAPLIYHGVEVGAFLVSDQNGVTTELRISSSDYTYSTGVELAGTYVSVTLTDDASGQQIDFLDNFISSTAIFAPNLQSVTLAPTAFDLQSYNSCCEPQTITVGATWTATGNADHRTVVSRFCGPPQPCFGMYNQVVTSRQATVAVTISGTVDGVDLSQLVWNADAGINSRTGVYLVG